MDKHQKADSSTDGKQVPPDSLGSVNLFHASQCSDDYCTLPGCHTIRMNLKHLKLCSQTSKESCVRCDELRAICLEHAKECQAVELTLELGDLAVELGMLTAEGFTYDWTVFVRGVEGHNIHCIVDKVVFHFHDKFLPTKKVIKKPPYYVSKSGYAGSIMPIDVYFRTKEDPSKVTFVCHMPLCHPYPQEKTRIVKVYFENPSSDFRAMLTEAGGHANCPVPFCNGGKFRQERLQQSLEKLQTRLNYGFGLTGVSSSTTDIEEQQTFSNQQQNRSWSPDSDTDCQIVPFVKEPPLVIDLEENEKETEKQVEEADDVVTSDLDILLSDNEEPKNEKPNSRFIKQPENIEKEKTPVENVENTASMDAANITSKNAEAEKQVVKDDDVVTSDLDTLLRDNEEPKNEKPNSRVMNQPENVEKEKTPVENVENTASMDAENITSKNSEAEKQVEKADDIVTSDLDTLLSDNEEPKNEKSNSKFMNQAENVKKEKTPVENVENTASMDAENITSKNAAEEQVEKDDDFFIYHQCISSFAKYHDEEPKTKKPKSRLMNQSEDAGKENPPVNYSENTASMNVENISSKNSVDECKKRRRNIKDTYGRKKKKTGSAAPRMKKGKKWPLEEKLSFLQTAEEHRRSLPNLTAIEGEEYDSEQVDIIDQHLPGSASFGETLKQAIPTPTISPISPTLQSSSQQSSPRIQGTSTSNISRRTNHQMKVIAQLENRGNERNEIIQKLLSTEQNLDEVDLFFQSMAKSVKKLPPHLQQRAKVKTLRLINKLEVEMCNSSVPEPIQNHPSHSGTGFTQHYSNSLPVKNVIKLME